MTEKPSSFELSVSFCRGPVLPSLSPTALVSVGAIGDLLMRGDGAEVNEGLRQAEAADLSPDQFEELLRRVPPGSAVATNILSLAFPVVARDLLRRGDKGPAYNVVVSREADRRLDQSALDRLAPLEASRVASRAILDTWNLSRMKGVAFRDVAVEMAQRRTGAITEADLRGLATATGSDGPLFARMADDFAEFRRQSLRDAQGDRGLVFNSDSPLIADDREIVMAAVSIEGGQLEHASVRLKADRDIVLKAVGNEGYALEFASPELQAERDVVLKAVRNRGGSLQFASPELKADPSVVAEAIEHGGPKVLVFASSGMKLDARIQAAIAKWSEPEPKYDDDY